MESRAENKTRMGKMRPSFILLMPSLDDGTREHARTCPIPGRFQSRNSALPTLRRESSKTLESTAEVVIR